MDRRRFDKLRRGRIDPEARLDLHGMTSERAHAALTGFILDAHAGDLRLVLVITGKGRADDAASAAAATASCATACRTGWRPADRAILQVAPAHQRHGGAAPLRLSARRR